MLVDTHVHLYLPAFDADRDDVVARALAAGVGRMLLPAIDPPTIGEALALCDRYEGVEAMAAVHPCSVGDVGDDAIAGVARALADPRVVAVGETGLDYYWSRDEAVWAAQQDSLRAHARLAIEHDLPLVLHVRDRGTSTACAEDTLTLLRTVRDAHPDGARLRGVFHCFGGPPWLADAVLDLGFCLGLGGTTTYRSSGVLDAVAHVPLDRIVLETDGPYLAPVPHRGGRNEPAHVRIVAEALASHRQLTLDDVADATTATAARLFAPRCR